MTLVTFSSLTSACLPLQLTVSEQFIYMDNILREGPLTSISNNDCREREKGRKKERERESPRNNNSNNIEHVHLCCLKIQSIVLKSCTSNIAGLKR